MTKRNVQLGLLSCLLMAASTTTLVGCKFKMPGQASDSSSIADDGPTPTPTPTPTPAYSVSITTPSATTALTASNDSATFAIGGACNVEGAAITVKVNTVSVTTTPSSITCTSGAWSATIDTLGYLGTQNSGNHDIVATITVSSVSENSAARRLTRAAVNFATDLQPLFQEPLSGVVATGRAIGSFAEAASATNNVACTFCHSPPQAGRSLTAAPTATAPWDKTAAACGTLSDGTTADPTCGGRTAYLTAANSVGAGAAITHDSTTALPGTATHSKSGMDLANAIKSNATFASGGPYAFHCATVKQLLETKSDGTAASSPTLSVLYGKVGPTGNMPQFSATVTAGQVNARHNPVKFSTAQLNTLNRWGLEGGSCPP